MILITSSLTIVAVGLVAYRRSGSVTATAFVLILSSLALISFLVPRPVIFSYLLMSLVVLAWDRPMARWTLPFLFWLWAAVHASFVIGLAYVGLSLIMEREWPELPKALVSGLATLLTAHGLGTVAFLIDFGSTSDALRYLTEWRSPELLEPVFLPVLGGITFIVIGAFRDRIYPRHLWVIVPFTVLSLSSVRAIPPAWLGLAPVVALSMSGLQLGSRAGLRPRLAVVFAATVFALPFLLIDNGELSQERFPIGALGALDESKTFHDDVIGGFLIWAEGPERKVYIDDRAELYGDRMGEFVMVRTGELPWEPVFEREGIRQVLLRRDEDLVSELRRAGWKVAYQDDEFSVLRSVS
jgi:hypothetical protein